jgi:SAM-dependent methyltransferase
MNPGPAAYQEDLAYIHDAGFGFVARGAAPVLLQALPPRGLVIELGCGSGILSAAIVAAGYDILGYDLSPAMLALAQQRVPRGTFRPESLWTAELPPCVGIAAVGECINYLFDRRNTAAALSRLLKRIHAALVPGGVLLCDFATPGRVPGRGPRQGFREGDDWAVLVTSEEDREHMRLTRHITSFRQVGTLYRRSHEVHRLRLIEGHAVTEELSALSFRVRRLRRYGDYRMPPGYVGLLGLKK